MGVRKVGVIRYWDFTVLSTSKDTTASLRAPAPLSPPLQDESGR